jgi:hypothetical protein
MLWQFWPNYLNPGEIKMSLADKCLKDLQEIAVNTFNERDLPHNKPFHIGTQIYNNMFRHIDEVWREYIKDNDKNLDVLKIFDLSESSVPHKIMDKIYCPLFLSFTEEKPWDTSEAKSLLTYAFG